MQTLGYRGLLDSTFSVALERLRSPIQTDRAINTVLFLCAIGIVALGVVAVQLGTDKGPSFLAWSVISALAATLAGGVLGLLFALPATRRSEVRTTDGRVEVSGSGYEESTALEQIADWLTKIIVGLTLTQWATWSAAFDRLSLTLTHDLLCPGSSTPCGYAPGGVLVAAYALAGFIVAYLWTRRFFILEMVTRDDAVRRMIRAQEQRSEAAKEGRVQQTSNAATAADTAREYADEVQAALEDARRNAVGAAKAVAAKLEPGEDPEDPWRGAFGGLSATAEAMLTATVSSLPDQPRNFKVNLTVAGVTPEAQLKLAGQKVFFFLHPTFGKEVKAASFSSDGRATLDLYAYGAFTVGALIEDGTTLELNLAALPGVPDQFKIS